MSGEPFRDRVAVVTGGASGIGQALCRELGRRGAIVVVADIQHEAAEQVAAEIERSGGRAAAAHVDVSRQESVDSMVGDAVARHGRLDYMFNNAGVAASGDARDLTLEHWRHVVDVNLWGVIYGTLAAYPVMVRQQGGHVVNTASVTGLVPFPGGLPYAATKHAIVGLSTSLRAEAAELGVKVSVACPGFVESNIYQAGVVVNVSREAWNEKLFFKKMDVAKAAGAILRGVARNRGIIVFPMHARLLWWAQRVHPRLLAPLGRKAVRLLREVRGQGEPPAASPP